MNIEVEESKGGIKISTPLTPRKITEALKKLWEYCNRDEEYDDYYFLYAKALRQAKIKNVWGHGGDIIERLRSEFKKMGIHIIYDPAAEGMDMLSLLIVDERNYRTNRLVLKATMPKGKTSFAEKNDVKDC